MRQSFLFIVVMTIGASIIAPTRCLATISNNGQTTNNANGCASGSTTCNLTVPSTPSGGLLVVVVGLAGGDPATISSASGGGTWTHPTGCSITNASGGHLDMAYNLASTSGATSISVTLSGSSTNAWTLEYRVYTSTGSGFTFDGACGTNASVASCTSCVMPNVGGTMTGTNDVVISGMGCAQTCSAAGAPFGNFNNAGVGDCFVDHLNTTSATGATCTQSPAGVGSGLTFAFAETGGGGGGGGSATVNKRKKLEALLYWPFPSSAGLGGNYQAGASVISGVLTVPQLDSTCVNGNEATTANMQCTASITSGDFVIITTTAVRPAAVPSLTDSLGNVIVNANPSVWPFHDTGQDGDVTVWYIQSAIGGTDIFTETAAGANSALELHVSSWKQMVGWIPDQAAATFGCGSGCPNGNAASFSSPSVTPTKNGELIFGYTFPFNTSSPGTGFTQLTLTDGDIDEYQIECSSCSSSISASFTQSGSNTWMALVQSFMTPF